ncbi:hypothetical protein HY631_03070 [Candidatus Uhrbacteria bacterium]|nr:hypothetical protein [Candidatus Uhrbacteria bacterium]
MKPFQTLLFLIVIVLIGGVAVLYWGTTVEDATVPVEVVEEPRIEPRAEEKEKIYEDTFLSFEYPHNVELLFEKPMGGRSDSQSISFLVYDETQKIYIPTHLRLSYMVSLGESEDSSFETIDDLLKNYEEYSLETKEYAVDGKRAIQIVTGDMSGETFFLVVQADEPGDAYRFSGSYLNETVDEILGLFMETAKLNQ